MRKYDKAAIPVVTIVTILSSPTSHEIMIRLSRRRYAIKVCGDYSNNLLKIPISSAKRKKTFELE